MLAAIGNFGHLEEFDPPLAALGGFAEQYFVDDANTALIKTRQFAERLAWVVAKRSGVGFEPGEAFVDILRKLQVDGVPPREILDILHRLRKAGNTAVHDLQGERREAFDAIKLCHRLGVWLRATVTRNADLKIAFVPPAARRDDSEELRAMIEELSARVAQAETEAQRLTREAAEAAASGDIDQLVLAPPTLGVQLDLRLRRLPHIDHRLALQDRRREDLTARHLPLRIRGLGRFRQQVGEARHGLPTIERAHPPQPRRIHRHQQLLRR